MNTKESKNMEPIKNKKISKENKTALVFEIEIDDRAKERILKKNKRNFKQQQRLNWLKEKKLAQQEARKTDNTQHPKFVDKSKF